jgi:hypothetical protein
MLPLGFLSLSLLALRQTPAGTQLHVRLTSPISSYSSSVGDTVRGVLIAPINDDAGDVILPEGSTLSGAIKRVNRVGFGLVHETATLELQFNQIDLPDGGSLSISSRVREVDNGRERVIEDGTIRGVRTTASIAYRASGYIRTALCWSIHARLALWAIKTLLIQVPEPEIYYAPGAELTLSLSEPLTSMVSDSPPDEPAQLSDDEREQLRAVAAEIPYRTSSRSNLAADPINMMFVGKREQITAAFAAAGWTEAEPATLLSRLRGVRAVAEGRWYRGAPVSRLLLNDIEPDMSWQKGLNDFAKRHHVRIWKQAVTWNGEEVWAGAATRDVDFAYMRANQMVTHRIELNIDHERDKIANDLRFTSCASIVDLWDRPGAPLEARNATGDRMSTDGQIAVIHLRDCDARSALASDVPQLRVHGNYFQRLLRRQILSARSDFYRKNIYYRSYEVSRWMVTTIRHRLSPPNPDAADAPPTTVTASLFTRARNSSWFR